MEFLTATALSGVIYDLMKSGIAISGSAIKGKLQSWILDDACVERLALEVNKLNINDEMSEKAIDKRLSGVSDIADLIAQINASGSKVSINQNHSGTGDNIGNNQYINKL